MTSMLEMLCIVITSVSLFDEGNGEECCWIRIHLYNYAFARLSFPPTVVRWGQHSPPDVRNFGLVQSKNWNTFGQLL